jgi:hypothetical protein
VQLPPLFAQMVAFQSVADALVWFAVSTVVFLLLCGGVLRWSRTVASKLISLGILAAILSVAHGGFSPPAALPLSTGLMKIAVILVLGGVACSMFSFLGVVPAADAARPKETVHEG